MNKIVYCIVIVLCLAAPPVHSDEFTDKLGGCMVDALNGKERKQLAKWIFFAIAAHPEIKSYLKATAQNIAETDESIGKLITRLLIDDCPEELKAAYRTNPQALQQPFELLGQVAMQELLTDQSVTKAITNYVQYTDLEKINLLMIDRHGDPLKRGSNHQKTEPEDSGTE
jgi:hypothetical protein